MRALWLPEALRGAGLTVETYSGWEGRGSDSFGPINGVVDHATAGTGSDAQEKSTLWVTGSTSAPAPIAQCYLNRAGVWTVGASGRCNHVNRLDGKPTSPLYPWGNANLIGVEAANDNRGEPWPAAQLASYTRGVAAILRHLGLPASRTCAHWEHQTGKSDPFGIDMVKFRLDVARHLNPSPTPGGSSMRLFAFDGDSWQSAGPYGRYRVPSATDWHDLVRIWGVASIYPAAKLIDGQPWPVCALDAVAEGSDPPKRPDGGNPWTEGDVLERFGPPLGGPAPPPAGEVPDHAHEQGSTGGVIRPDA
jgi:hypothetical protein